MNERVMTPGKWVAVWGRFGALLVAGETVSPSAFGMALVWFAVFEAVAAKAEGKGDTLSEQIWALYSGKPVRILLVLGIAVYLGLVIVSFLGNTDYQTLRVWFLAGCVTAWLLLHWLLPGKGRHG